MITSFRIGIIFCVFVPCVHLRDLCSSYFTFSHWLQKQSIEDARKTAEFTSTTMIACVLRCNTNSHCDEATFNRDSKRCSLYQNRGKDSTNIHTSDIDANKRIVTLRKVPILSVSENLKGSCASGSDNSDDNDFHSNSGTRGSAFSPITDDQTIMKASCADILRQNCSSPSGFYNITTGGNTWKTYCSMRRLPGCGDGGWTLIMRINGSKNTFAHNSTQWASISSYQTIDKVVEAKLPGYWLSSFNKICVIMKFSSKVKFAILFNHNASSLHAALNAGKNKRWRGELSKTTQPSWFSSSINTNCLEQGFSLFSLLPLTGVKTRVGIQSQTSICSPPYLVRGFGFGYHSPNKINKEISCGDIISNPFATNTYPAFCSVYVQ